VHGSQQQQYPHTSQQPGIGGAYGSAAPPATVRSSMYPAENMGHPQQQQPQQGGSKQYPYSMQAPYSSMSAQHFMSESTAQPTQQQQHQQQDVPSVYQQPQQPQPQPNQMHNTPHYR